MSKGRVAVFRNGIPFLALCAAAIAVLSTNAQATPEPNPVPVAWELSLEPSPLMRIQVDTGSGPKIYWYMLYTVTNNTGQDIDFHPEIVRVNEIESELAVEKISERPDQAPTVCVDPAIVGLNNQVYKAIAERHARTHPFLVTPVNAIGRLLQGKDNARTSVAVFPDLDPRVSRFTIYFGGLSGEKVTRPNPSYDSSRAAQGSKSNGHGDDENPKLFVLRKTLSIPYTLPGDVRTRQNAQPVLGRMTWVMR